MDNFEKNAAAGVGCFGCLWGILWLAVYGAIAVLVIWTFLAAIGFVERFPWQ